MIYRASIGRALIRGALILPVAFAASAQETAGQEAAIEPLERIVALVDEDPIFASELERAALSAREASAREARAGEAGASDSPGAPVPSLRQLLDQLIDERLRAHEVDRYGAQRVSDEEVRSHLENAPPGLDADRAESLVRRQLRILAHVEERLGALVFISDEAVRGYYESTLRDEMLRQGAALPPFEDVQEAIRALLREEALEQRIVLWTEELRQRAEIIDLLDEPMSSGALPPTRLTIRPESKPEATVKKPEQKNPEQKKPEKEKPWPSIP